MSNSTFVSFVFEKISHSANVIVNLDYLYIEWLLSLFYPYLNYLFFLFLVPAVMVSMMFIQSLAVFLIKFYVHVVKKADYYNTDVWQASYKSLCIIWETIGDIWHGYEIVGFENIPEKGRALLIYYHAAMPLDFYYLYSKTLLYKNRRMKIIADRFLFKVPGLGSLLEAFEVTPGSKNQCVKLLEKEHMLSISPGGVREALFSDHNYEVIWGTRAGFAKIAIEAKCPIIPMYTQNSREALRTIPFFKNFFRMIYEKTRLPLLPIYGLFPVKMRTIIGKPIEYDENLSVDELRDLTKLKIEELIQEHQTLPGNIFSAILDRFRSLDRFRNVKKY